MVSLNIENHARSEAKDTCGGLGRLKNQWVAPICYADSHRPSTGKLSGAWEVILEQDRAPLDAREELMAASQARSVITDLLTETLLGQS